MAASASTAIPNFEKFKVLGDEHTAGVRWKRYIAKFEMLTVAMNIQNAHGRKKALLLHVAGDEVFDIFMTFTEEQKGGDTAEGYNTMKQSLLNYFEPKKNLDFEVVKFRQEMQREGETIDSFCTRLRQLALRCDFENADRELKVQLLTGTNSKRLKRRALRDEHDLEGILKLARSLEVADRQALEMEKTTETVNFTRKSQKQNFKKTSSKSFSAHKCGWCGSDQRHPKRLCPAKDEDCLSCGKHGHYAKVCRNKPKQSKKFQRSRAMQVQEEARPSNVDSESDTDTDDSDYTFSVGKTPTVDVAVNGKCVKFFVDTGASVNILDEKTANSLVLPLSHTQAKVHAYGSSEPLTLAGKASADITFRDKTSEKETFFVVKSKIGGNLLSAHTAQELGLVHFAFSCQRSIPDSYPDLYEGIGKMNDQKVTLHIDHTVKSECQPHRRIPYHMRKKVEAELQRLEDLDIIEKVDGPTPWVSPIVVAPKPKSPDEIRLCVDMRIPNKAIKRTRHIMPTIDDILMQLNQSTVFSKLDLTAGYHQLELTEESRNITTFTTHVGLRRYKRLNFGVTSAAEIFQNAIAEMLSDIPDALNTSDDILIHGRNQEEHDKTLIRVLDRIREKGLTLNKKKCQYNKDSIEFYGFVFGKNGVSADQKKVEAIKNMSRPTTPKEVRSFLGMTNYISRFIPQYADVTKPLRDLTRKTSEWKWTEEQEQAFLKLKEQVTKPQTMAYFDEKSKTEVIVDASPVGLGAILAQEDKRGQRKIIAYASRALTDVESRYSQTEREALAVVWACEHFHLYVFGQQFTVISDHKPLEGIFNSVRARPNARIERWSLRLQSYDFVLRYKPGDDNPADFLSRHPVNPAKSKTPHETKVAEEYIALIANHTVPKSMTVNEVREATDSDGILQLLMQAVQTGRWCKELEQYHRFRHELSVYDGLVFRCSRLIIPHSLQQKVIAIAHQAHQGIVKTKQCIREKVWFPNIDKMVEETVKSCIPCQASNSQSDREPIIATELPEKPWHSLAMDFAGPFGGPNGDYAMVVIDEYSRYPEVEIISSVSGSTVLPRLDTIFARWGIPNNIKSDNGAPFMGGEFKEFAQSFGFEHHKIMPEHPEANGEVERFMRTLNRMIRSSVAARLNWRTRLPTFLRIYRSTPHSSTKISPFEALTNRKMNCGLPCITLPSSTPHPSPHLHSQIALNDHISKSKMCEYTDAKRHTKPCYMKPGDTVLVKQKRQNKLTPPFSPDPYEITARKGSMVTAQRGDHTITRNSSHFKVMKGGADPTLPPSPPRPAEDRESDPIPDTQALQPTASVTPGQPPPSPASVPAQTSAQMSAPLQTSAQMSTPLQTSAQMSAPLEDAPRRSSRMKQPPVKLKDYTT